MDDKLLKPYSPTETEQRIYKLWEESGFFNPDNLPERHKEPYTIVMPPPNANGRLHAGHALFITLEDIMIRYNRMLGKKALWVPGADHAGFETQIVYEKKLEKEGRSRFGMDQKQLYEEILSFTLENKQYMEDDVRRLGASCDWSREKFTLDPSVIKEVQNTFKKMYDDGLVYRGNRIINWCYKHQTSLSDVETEFKEQKDPFYYFQYGPFVIGTVRPETKFGDKYVVMHPDDKRYREYKHGQKIDLEWINGPMTATVIKDPASDMEYGTGVMTITPWHSGIDFEIAERYNLDKEQIIDFYGKLLPTAGEFAGMKITEARQKIVEKLKAKGLLVKVDENYIHNVKVCYKCNSPIEPQIKEQWFVKMKPLAQKAIEVVEKNEITFIPENYRKIFLYWMNNTIDWNISRQIVWGIPIPAWFHEPKCIPKERQEKDMAKCKQIVVSSEKPTCEFCDGEFIKDPDTFDTWFSSGQWTLLSLGYPNGKDVAAYHPTDVMETGHDLIFKWVPRMVIFALYLKKEIPFKTVYLHGLVNDAKGQKMSKSKGNVISPIDIVDKYGTDALRMALVVGNTPGSDLALAEDKIKGYKHFSNKIWNAARFVLSNTQNIDLSTEIKMFDGDIKILEELKTVSKEVTEDINKFRYYLAAEKLYHFFWHTFADKIIEEAKPRLNQDKNSEDKLSIQYTLLVILKHLIKMLHPFMPFITEELWSMVPKTSDESSMLLIEKWPTT